MNTITKPFFNSPALYKKGPPNQRKFGRYRGQVEERSQGDQTKYNNNQQPIKVLNHKKTFEQNNYSDKYNGSQQTIIYSPKIVSPPIEQVKIEQIDEKHQSKEVQIKNEPLIIPIQQKEELKDIIATPEQISNEPIEISQQIQLNQQQPQVINAQPQPIVQTFPQQLIQPQPQLLISQQLPTPPIMYNIVPNANPYSPVPFPYSYQNPPYPPTNQPYVQSQCIFPNISVTSTQFILNAEEIQKYAQFLMEQLRIYEQQNNIILSKPQ